MKIFYNLADQNFETAKSVGILHVATQLMENIARQAGIATLVVAAPPGLRLNNVDGKKVDVRIFSSASRGRLQRIWWDQAGAYLAARRSGCDWLFLPKGFSAFVPWRKPRTAAYVHDTMHSFYRANYPGFFSPMEMAYFEKSLHATLSQSKLIFTNSAFSRDQILALARQSGGNVPHVLKAGIGFDFSPAHFQPGNRSGTIAFCSVLPHKKTAMAVDFLAEWCTRSQANEIVHWVGGWPKGVDQPHRPGWHYHGRLSDSDIQLLFSRCSRLLYSSEYEGFGMPPVEAVARGMVPVYSEVPALTEVMHGAGFPFINDDFESFTRAMNASANTSHALLEEWRECLAGAHSWESTAKIVCRGLQSAL